MKNNTLLIIMLAGFMVVGLASLYALYHYRSLKSAEKPAAALELPIECPTDAVTEFTYVFDPVTKNTTEQVKCDKDLWYFIKKESKKEGIKLPKNP